MTLFLGLSRAFVARFVTCLRCSVCHVPSLLGLSRVPAFIGGCLRFRLLPSLLVLSRAFVSARRVPLFSALAFVLGFGLPSFSASAFPRSRLWPSFSAFAFNTSSCLRSRLLSLFSARAFAAVSWGLVACFRCLACRVLPSLLCSVARASALGLCPWLILGLCLGSSSACALAHPRLVPWLILGLCLRLCPSRVFVSTLVVSPLLLLLLLVRVSSASIRLCFCYLFGLLWFMELFVYSFH